MSNTSTKACSSIAKITGRSQRSARKNSRDKQPTRVKSDSTEDHLERIADLVSRKGYARVADVAIDLGLNRSTVSNMVKRLAQRGYLNYEKYRGFSLTREGKAVAERITARHNTLTNLFTALGLDKKIVEQEVEDMEHHLRPETLELLSTLVGYWRKNPKALGAFLNYVEEFKGEFVSDS